MNKFQYRKINVQNDHQFLNPILFLKKPYNFYKIDLFRLNLKPRTVDIRSSHQICVQNMMHF